MVQRLDSGDKMIRSFTIAALAFATFGVATPSLAQTADADLRDFCADRPGKGTPTCILDVGRWQVELGLFDGARQTGDGFKVESQAYGDTFLRYGLTPTTEIQFGLTPYSREEVTDRTTGISETADGIGDLSIGFRHSLANPDGSGVSIALAGFLTEVSLTEGSAAIVVDDPVSSLDRERCLLVAQRLAAESKNRQVIVFTHDIIFFNELCREADELGVEAVTTALFSDKKVAGRIDAGGVSWKGAKVNNRHSPSGPPLDFKIA